jgi:hypothetical protein
MNATVIDGFPEVEVWTTVDRDADDTCGARYDRVRLLDNGYLHGLITSGYQQDFIPSGKVVEVVQTDPDNAPIPDDGYKVDHGGEIHFRADLPIRSVREFALLPGGWLATSRAEGGAVYYPADGIEGVYTHTSNEQENADWFRKL